MRALPQRHNLGAGGLHPIQVDRSKMRQHAGEVLRPLLYFVMSVVEIVHHTRARIIHAFDNFQLIFGFPEPPAVIVERNGAAGIGRQGIQMRHHRRALGDPFVVVQVREVVLVKSDPIVDRQSGLIDGIDHGQIARAEPARFVFAFLNPEPDRRQFDPVRPSQGDLLRPRRQVFLAPIPRILGEPQPRQHLNPFPGTALLRVKRHNAPCDEIILGEQLCCPRRGLGRPHANDTRYHPDQQADFS